MSRDWQLRDWQSSITSRIIEKLLKEALGSLGSCRQKRLQPTAKGAGMYRQELEVVSHLCQLQAGLGRAFKVGHSAYTPKAVLPGGREKKEISFV